MSVNHPVSLIRSVLNALVFGQQKVVCIDPGHPSDYSMGTKGHRATEVKVNWDYALLLKTALEARNIRVVLTKSSVNQNVSNKRRAEIANENGTNLMVRLHCDGRAQRGIAVYYPNRQGVAKDGSRGPSNQVITRSKAAAKLFHSAVKLKLTGKFPDFGLRTEQQTDVGAKQGALTGSIFSQVPVLLVEICNLSNKDDENYVLSPTGKATMTEALLSGVLAALGGD